MRKITNKISRVIRDTDYCSYTALYFVKAQTKANVIKMLDDAGVEVDGVRVTSCYDCSGQYFCGPIRERDITWSKSRKCYVVTHRWFIDI